MATTVGKLSHHDHKQPLIRCGESTREVPRSQVHVKGGGEGEGGGT